MWYYNQIKEAPTIIKKCKEKGENKIMIEEILKNYSKLLSDKYLEERDA